MVYLYLNRTYTVAVATAMVMESYASKSPNNRMSAPVQRTPTPQANGVMHVPVGHSVTPQRMCTTQRCVSHVIVMLMDWQVAPWKSVIPYVNVWRVWTFKKY